MTPFEELATLIDAFVAANEAWMDFKTGAAKARAAAYARKEEAKDNAIHALVDVFETYPRELAGAFRAAIKVIG